MVKKRDKESCRIALDKDYDYCLHGSRQGAKAGRGSFAYMEVGKGRKQDAEALFASDYLSLKYMGVLNAEAFSASPRLSTNSISN